METILTGIGLTLLTLIGIGMVFLYFRNMYKVVVALRQQEYSVQLFFRIIGIFFFFMGVVMGMV